MPLILFTFRGDGEGITPRIEPVPGIQRSMEFQGVNKGNKRRKRPWKKEMY
jgi:hypothetical protein